MPEHLFSPYFWAGHFFAPSGLYFSITPSGRTPLPSVGMLRYTDHQGIIIVLNVIVIPVLTVTIFRRFSHR